LLFCNQWLSYPTLQFDYDKWKLDEML